MDTSFDRFVKEQVEKQKLNRDPVEALPLDFTPFETALASFEPETVGPWVEGKSIDSMQRAIADGHLTYETLCLYYLSRIRSEKNIHRSLIRLAPDALSRAREADQQKGERGPLHGLPIVVKDNIGTGKELPTTAGSVLLKDLPVKKSPLVEKIETSGAYVLAKTNLSEWAFYMSTDGVCGFSSMGGQTMHATGSYEAGGSSTGTAVALALGLAPLGIGTETNGSILYPAGQNGVVGFYPARGTWPAEGILPISHHLDTPGPMAKDVSDARSFAEVISGPFERLEGTKVVVFDPPAEEWGRGSDPELIEQAASFLQDQGIAIERKPFPESAYSISLSPVLEGDFAADVNAFFTDQIDGPVALDFESIVNAYRTDAAHMAPYGMDLLEQALDPKLSGGEVDRLAKVMADRAKGILDDILAGGGVCLGINSQLSNIYAACGYPSLVVPGGCREDGEPYGIAITARPGEEDRLFQIGTLIEKV